MIDSFGRSLYQKAIVNPVLPLFAMLSPTAITCLAVALGISVLPLLSLKYSGLALSMLLLSGFLDTMDGSVARYKHQSTPFGTALDITGDRMVEFSVVLGLYLYEPGERGLSSLVMLGSILFCVTSFLVVGIFTQNTSAKGFHYSPGLMERAEAFIFFAVMIIFPSIFLPLSSLFSTLVVLTAFRRLWQFRKFTQSEMD